MTPTTSTQDNHRKMLSALDTLITLTCNVGNGCVSDIPEMEKETARLEGMKNWAIENDTIQEVKAWFASKTFSDSGKFAAAKLAAFFCA